jgi:WD40 repeat protein
MISVFNLQNGNKLADLNAHGRWINAISVKDNTLASCSDDCYVRLWNLGEINGKFDIKHVQSEHIPDAQVTGVSFLNSADKFCAVSYDFNEILFHEQD